MMPRHIHVVMLTVMNKMHSTTTTNEAKVSCFSVYSVYFGHMGGLIQDTSLLLCKQ